MFGKRRRAASNPVSCLSECPQSSRLAHRLPQRAPPSASASLAATTAFARGRDSNGALSSAAAAAALRTHVATPTAVGDTVTKRMVRRNSASSNGSLSRPGGLRRQSSSGSMTERSFRAGSPAEPRAPPVPPVPKSMADGGAAHRRASSLEPVYRGGSPAPRGGGLDRGVPAAAARGQRPTSHLAHVAEEDAAQRSINFSRPMSPAQTASPSPQQSGHGWFGGPVVNQEAVQRMASTSRPKPSTAPLGHDVQSTQQAVQNAAHRPVKTNHASHAVQGQRLSSGSMRAKPSGSAVQSRSFLQQSPRQVDPKSSDAIYDPSTRSFIHKQDAMARHRELHEEPEQPTQQYIAQHVDDYHQHHLPRQQSVQPQALPASQPTPSGSTEEQQGPPHAPEPRVGALMGQRNPHDLAAAHVQLVSPTHDAGAEQAQSIVSSSLAPNQDSSYPRLEPPATTQTSINAGARQGVDSIRTVRDRQSSLSPPRSAHFAPMAVELAGEKHQPPARSISPAKSALKPSPSVSRRGSSPITLNGHLASSETSDTASEDGSRKRRNIRVSFEETPKIAGSAAYAEPETPTTPPGLSTSKWSPQPDTQVDEFTDFMKPRSALPSFSSIRDKDRPSTHEHIAEKVTETVSTTPMSASVSSIGEPLQASSDHIVGGIFAQDFARKHDATNDPLPPEVTSVEGTGYVSDSSEDSTIQKHGEAIEPSQQPPEPEPKSLTTPLDENSSSISSASERIVEIPQIALLPATPSPHERPEPKFQSMMVPGGWDEEAPESNFQHVGHPGIVSKDLQSSSVVQPVQQQPVVSNAEDHDSVDDNSSVYSDAYEDLSDTEAGFGSINAIVESPAAPSSSGLMFSRYADQSATENPTSKPQHETDTDNSADSDATPTQNWDATRQHWSGVHASRQTQPQQNETSINRQSHAEDAVPRVMQAPVSQEKSHTGTRIAAGSVTKTAAASQDPQPPPKPLKSALKKAATAETIPQAEPQMRQSMRGPSSRQGVSGESHLKKTMRVGPGSSSRAEPQMRSSMRGAPDPAPRAQPQLRQSMRNNDITPSTPSTSLGLAASRHSMVPVETKPPRGALQKRHIPTAAMAPKPRPQSLPTVKQPTATVPTYDSDSDASASSFQRTRARGSRNQGGRYTMRASMRNDSTPTMRTTAPAPAPKQLRSISPPLSPSPAIRKSMRPSSPTPEPAKSSRFSIRSLSPMGRFRSSRALEPAPPLPTQSNKMAMPAFSTQPKPKTSTVDRTKARKVPLKSRFADSSDEDDDDQPRRFQSRFADSDSDDADDYRLPPGLTPVRGIPRKAGEEDGDSTDLEEEADDQAPPIKAEPVANKVPSGQTNGNANGQGAALSIGSLRDSKHAPALPSFEAGSNAKSKRTFFGLGKNKKKNAGSRADTALSNAATPEIPMPASQRNRELGLPLTPIDEDKDMDIGGASANTSPQTKKSPKLQRRSTPEWPLPLPPTIGNDERPLSSDGIAPRRPRFLNRQSSTTSNATAPVVDAQGRSVSYGRSGKKKKFQGLRRVFGLND